MTVFGVLIYIFADSYRIKMNVARHFKLIAQTKVQQSGYEKGRID